MFKKVLGLQITIFDESLDVVQRKSIELADSHLFDENISLRSNSAYIYKHIKRAEKEMSKYFSKAISKLEPVKSSKVEITIGKCSFKAKKCDPSFANIEINAFENADKENITRIVQNLLLEVHVYTRIFESKQLEFFNFLRIE